MPGVTKEQIRQAREADLFAYLERHERGVLKRDGPNYRHKEHDSLVYVTAKNYWYWNSRGKRINALDYLMEIRGYDLVDAVNVVKILSVLHAAAAHRGVGKHRLHGEVDDLRVFRGKAPVTGENDAAAMGQPSAAGQGLQGLAAHEAS